MIQNAILIGIFKYFRLIILVFSMVSLGITVRANERDGALLDAAISATFLENWKEAKQLAQEISDPAGRMIIHWIALRKGKGHWAEYMNFLINYDDWPGLKGVKKAAELVMPKSLNTQEVLDFFENYKPQTPTGAIRLADALMSDGQHTKGQKVIVDAWVNLVMTTTERDIYIRRFKAFIAPYHKRRMQNLLWNNFTAAAEEQLPYVPAAYAPLARARIALQQREEDVNHLINKIPNALGGDAGLAYDRFQWRIKEGLWDSAHDMILSRTQSLTLLERPEKWATRRRGFARRALRAGKINQAYKLASQHYLTSGSDFADLEWLSGYIALTYLDNPTDAIKHFQTFNKAVVSTISKARGYYWTAMAYEAMVKYDMAYSFFKKAAQYQTTFYGQIAAQKLGHNPAADLYQPATIVPISVTNLENTSVFAAAKLLAKAKRQMMARWFFTHLAESAPPQNMHSLAHYAMKLGYPHITLKIAKFAAQKHIIMPDIYFPVIDIKQDDGLIKETELLMSIMRQESEFNAHAISPAGAIGLMQLMPKTAQKVSQRIGLEYKKFKLILDLDYNIKLGSTYLSEQLERFEGSYILAFAAYNAGPNRVEEWISEYGDPRLLNLNEVIDWIENIPYRETRNYVMRVMESLHIYRNRIAKKPIPLHLIEDLHHDD